jgi:hypothetical protein
MRTCRNMENHGDDCFDKVQEHSLGNEKGFLLCENERNLFSRIECLDFCMYYPGVGLQKHGPK